MLKIITLALAISLVPTAAPAGEASEKCGTKITWQGVKCAVALGTANGTLSRAERFERYAKHAEIDGDADKAQYWRNRAAYELAEGTRLKAAHTRKYVKK